MRNYYNLPAKTRILQKASVFNKETISKNFEEMKKDKSFLEKLPSKRENLFFRNYLDYLISLHDRDISPFKPIPLQKAFSSKEILELFKKDLKSIPTSKQINKIVVFDTETTDLYGYIVSYALVEYDLNKKEITNETYELVNPQTKINPEAFAVHKISDKDVKDKPIFKEICYNFLKILLNADLVVGHNIFYDYGVLKRELERVEYPHYLNNLSTFDTMYFSADIVELERKKMPKLEEAVAYFFGKQNVRYHNALEDVKITLKLFEKLVE